MTVEVKTIVNSIEVRTNPINKVEVATIGKQGPKGDSGRDAYELAVLHGFQGDYETWYESMKVKGDKGDQGDPAPDVLAQYSVDADVWDDEYNEDAEYIRFSYDGGESYGYALKFMGPEGQRGPTGPEVEFQYSADGNTWSDEYTDGDFYIRISSDEGETWGGAILFRGKQGEPGTPGSPGEPGLPGTDGQDGQDGRTILNGSTAPGAGVGDEGDFYLDTDACRLYGPKAGESWGAGVLLKGPQGDPGSPGEPGANAPQVTAQYSQDGLSWGDTYTQGAEYIRFSYDGGSSYGPAMKFKGADGSPGDPGGPGNPGEDGSDGKTILSGSGAPASALGEDGDFYLDTSAMEIYGPKSGTWGAGVSLIGPAGAGVPAIGSGDSGRVLAVKTDETGAEWIDPPSGGSGGVSLGLVIALS